MGPYESEGMPSDESSATEAQAAPESDTEETGPAGTTTLIPKSVCPGMDLEPGQVLKFKVLKSYEDEVEVQYVKGDEAEPSEMDRSESKLDEMAEPPPG